MKNIIYIILIFSMHSNAEIFGNKFCIYESASSIEKLCERSLAACERRLEEIKVTKQEFKAICISR